MRKITSFILLILVLGLIGCTRNNEVKPSKLSVDEIFNQEAINVLEPKIDVTALELITHKFNVKDTAGFLVLTEEGQGINLKDHYVIGSFQSTLTNAQVTPQFYYKYWTNDNNERMVTIYSSKDPKVLKNINLEINSFKYQQMNDYFVVTNNTTGISTKYTFKDFVMTESILEIDSFSQKFDLEIGQYGYVFNNNDVTIYKNNVYYDYQPRMTADKASNRAQQFFLNNGNILYFGLTYVLSDEDYDVIYNNQKAVINYELYEVESKKRKEIKLDFMVSGVINNSLFQVGLDSDLEILTNKAQNIVSAKRINPQTKTFIDYEDIILIADNKFESVYVFENDLGAVPFNNINLYIGANYYYQLKNEGLFVFDDFGKVKQHYFNISSLNQILYNKYILSSVNSIGEYAIYEMSSREMVSQKAKRLSSFGSNNYLFVDSNNSIKLFLSDGNFKTLNGTLLKVVNHFDNDYLNVYVTFDSDNIFSYYNQNGELLFKVHSYVDTLKIMHTYEENNSYRMLVSIQDITAGEKVFIIKGEIS